MKDKTILLNWILTISLSIILFSCHKEPTKFHWQPAISAPKYYPIGGVSVGFNGAGHGSLTNFDNGWGNQYGGVVSGDRYKEVPKEVHIKYYSAVDNLKYEGTVQLPQEKLLSLFREYNKKYNEKMGEKKTAGFSARIIVGMAPGGWIRVWFLTSDFGKFQHIEVAKAQLKGFEDPTIGEGFRYKTDDYWTKYKNYWKHHGIPYQAWDNNEKTYTLYFELEKTNKTQIGMSYVSLDGTYYQNIINNQYSYNKKLPTRMTICWLDQSKQDYCCKIDFPNGFQKLVEDQKSKEVRIRLEIEKDEQHGIIYLISNNQKIKILRFKNKMPSPEERKNIDYASSNEVEYFIK